jgi:hypothetical protein
VSKVTSQFNSVYKTVVICQNNFRIYEYRFLNLVHKHAPDYLTIVPNKVNTKMQRALWTCIIYRCTTVHCSTEPRVNFDVSFLYLPELQSWPCTSPPCRSRSKPAPSGPVWDWLADVASAGSSTRPNWLSRLAGPPHREVRTETPSRRTSLSANQSTINQSSEIPPHL